MTIEDFAAIEVPEEEDGNNKITNWCRFVEDRQFWWIGYRDEKHLWMFVKKREGKYDWFNMFE